MAVIFVSTGVGLSGGPIISSGTINLLPPVGPNIGGVKAGDNIIIAADGTISAPPPGIGTLTGVTPGPGLTGGGTSGNVTLGVAPATETTIGGVTVGDGLIIVGANLRVKPATLSQRGTVFLASASEVANGVDTEKAVTPATLIARTATTTRTGLVQLTNSTSSTSTTTAATASSVKVAFDAAVAANTIATNALPKSGGIMTGPIAFAPGQVFPGVSLPLATATSPGVVIPSTGLTISPGGYLTTTNNGTVSSIIAGTGLGAPAPGNAITTTGTIKLLPPSSDGTVIGGVKAGANINIQVDGEISTEGVLQTNNPYAYNSYIWPATASPVPAAPGENGQVLTLKNKVTGEIGWTQIGTVSSVSVGSGLTSTTVNGAVVINLSPSGVIPPNSTPQTFGATGLIPTLTIDAQGKVISAGEANPFAPFQNPTVSAPFNLVLDFQDNNTNWDFTMLGNTTLMNPTNAVSGQTGTILIRQNPTVPYVLTFGTAWKFPSFTPPAITPVAAAVDMLEFVVINANYIVVKNYLTNIG
jgi:hypothetical protein